jgi:L,D-peptidoglycan transpeptidase YkuD (ErfK/YbiS/YcfS/YnhG family)
VVKRRGSAIFLHVARPDLAPTEGCVALPLSGLTRLLAEGLTALRVNAD